MSIDIVVAKIQDKWKKYVRNGVCKKTCLPNVSVQQLLEVLNDMSIHDPEELFQEILMINRHLSEIPRYMFYGRDVITNTQIQEYEDAVAGDFYLGIGWSLFTKMLRKE
jgi:hypothetical protein